MNKKISTQQIEELKILLRNKGNSSILESDIRGIIEKYETL